MESSPDLFGDVSVEPAQPVAAYLGGKKNLARRLVPLIDGARARLYAEPFVGMGGIFLRRRIRSPVEVINDYSRDVATFFRILQRHYPQFIEVLRFQLTTRAEFERLSATDPDTLTDLERAARFLYLQSCAFAGKVSGRSFGVDLYQGGAFNLLSIVPRLEAVHARLAKVTIERLSYETFIARYDTAETLFYLDPPYWGGETDYGKDLFARADFAALADQLARIEGRFILSINDVPEIRELFAWADIMPVDVTYSVGENGQTAKELIIRNGQ
jgi:DNA adenine methylase